MSLSALTQAMVEGHGEVLTAEYLRRFSAAELQESCEALTRLIIKGKVELSHRAFRDGIIKRMEDVTVPQSSWEEHNSIVNLDRVYRSDPDEVLIVNALVRLTEPGLENRVAEIQLVSMIEGYLLKDSISRAQIVEVLKKNMRDFPESEHSEIRGLKLLYT